MRLFPRALFLSMLLVTSLVTAPAQAAADARTLWRLLDYLSVDYAGAVENGQVKRASEFAEMNEFAGTVRKGLDELPANPALGNLKVGAEQLQAAIAAKQSPEVVARQARALAADLLRAYPVPLAPKTPPDLARGAKLYSENCAACHGAGGNGDGPLAARLDPPPMAFAEIQRARQRSTFALYQVIGQGLEGTSMASFASMPDDDRWALALYIGQFAFPEAQAEQGRVLWQNDPSLHTLLPNLEALLTRTPAALAADVGEDKARALTAYLRRHPEAVLPSSGGSLQLTRTRLAESVKVYAAGDTQKAAQLALSAYLDGFEPVEPVLGARDQVLMRRIESAMGELRSRIGGKAPAAQVEAQANELQGLFAQAESVLDNSESSEASAFAGAATILLREGLEALLIVVAIIAFLRKAERGDLLRYVHIGWIGALLAGAATWAVATYLVGVSGASRELTEGFGSLFAAVVLIFVGIWMHGKSQAGAWQRYIRDKLNVALSRSGSGGFLFMLAFVVVYREVFETILFYAALWNQGNGHAILGGAGLAVAVLAALAWVMLAYTRKLPVAQFFSFSSALMAVLTVVLAGKGIAALQEAGVIGTHTLALPKFIWLGLYPTLQGICAQALALLVLIAGFAWNRKAARRAFA